MKRMLYSSNYEAILKILLVYLVEYVWCVEECSLDLIILLGSARPFFSGGGGTVFFLQ